MPIALSRRFRTFHSPAFVDDNEFDYSWHAMPTTDDSGPWFAYSARIDDEEVGRALVERRKV